MKRDADAHTWAVEEDGDASDSSNDIDSLFREVENIPETPVPNEDTESANENNEVLPVPPTTEDQSDSTLKQAPETASVQGSNDAAFNDFMNSLPDLPNLEDDFDSMFAPIVDEQTIPVVDTEDALKDAGYIIGLPADLQDDPNDFIAPPAIAYGALDNADLFSDPCSEIFHEAPAQPPTESMFEPFHTDVGQDLFQGVPVDDWNIGPEGMTSTDQYGPHNVQLGLSPRPAPPPAPVYPHNTLGGMPAFVNAGPPIPGRQDYDFAGLMDPLHPMQPAPPSPFSSQAMVQKMEVMPDQHPQVQDTDSIVPTPEPQLASPVSARSPMHSGGVVNHGPPGNPYMNEHNPVPSLGLLEPTQSIPVPAQQQLTGNCIANRLAQQAGSRGGSGRQHGNHVPIFQANSDPIRSVQNRHIDLGQPQQQNYNPLQSDARRPAQPPPGIVAPQKSAFLHQQQGLPAGHQPTASAAPSPQGTLAGNAKAPKSKHKVAKEKKRSYNILLHTTEPMDFEIKADFPINFTITEIVVLLPHWYKEQWFATRFCNNGVNPPEHRQMIRDHWHVSDDEPKRNSIQIAYASAMRGPASKRLVQPWKAWEKRRKDARDTGAVFTEQEPYCDPMWRWIRETHTTPANWDANNLSVTGWVPNRIRNHGPRPRQFCVPFRKLENRKIRRLPQGPDAADLTRSLEYVRDHPRMNSDGTEGIWMFPEHLVEVLRIIGSTQITPEHLDPACIARYKARVNAENFNEGVGKRAAAGSPQAKASSPPPAANNDHLSSPVAKQGPVNRRKPAKEKGTRLETVQGTSRVEPVIPEVGSPQPPPQSQEPPPLVRDDQAVDGDMSIEAQTIRFAQRPDQQEIDWRYDEEAITHIYQALGQEWLDHLNQLLDYSDQPLLRDLPENDRFPYEVLPLHQFVQREHHALINWRADMRHGNILTHFDVRSNQTAVPVEMLVDLVLNFDQYSASAMGPYPIAAVMVEDIMHIIAEGSEHEQEPDHKHFGDFLRAI